MLFWHWATTAAFFYTIFSLVDKLSCVTCLLINFLQIWRRVARRYCFRRRLEGHEQTLVWCGKAGNIPCGRSYTTDWDSNIWRHWSWRLQLRMMLLIMVFQTEPIQLLEEKNVANLVPYYRRKSSSTPQTQLPFLEEVNVTQSTTNLSLSLTIGPLQYSKHATKTKGHCSFQKYDFPTQKH